MTLNFTALKLLAGALIAIVTTTISALLFFDARYVAAEEHKSAQLADKQGRVSLEAKMIRRMDLKEAQRLSDEISRFTDRLARGETLAQWELDYLDLAKHNLKLIHDDALGDSL